MEKESLESSKNEPEERKLIKFSNYSLCVTLPKWVTRELKWNKGDIVKMFVDQKKGEILIKKSTKLTNPKQVESTKGKTNKKSRW